MPESPSARPVAVVTGASGGIGEASARRLAAAGYEVVLGARRVDRLEAIAADIDGRAIALDVTDDASVDAFAAQVPTLDVLVNNAGGALGADPVLDADLDGWRTMYETNVLGTVRVTKALIGALEASGSGTIINVGSIAGFEIYPGGGGYIAAKHGVWTTTRTLRLELLGRPIRVTEIQPGMVETDFARVRFDGDEEKAAAVYAGMTPLVADDVADLVAFVATRPEHVNLDSIVVRPRDQATGRDVHRTA
ncbi:SDR family NAD(P)-dependent oxidoreductase [Patulibacter minatonensis]|uniref:SDR family NAD(P)-dependent oxidoreductase n=1 Tax=Patulibacter minatonensis TaxID=298163 RepID=UPI000479BD26|nr:SDR family NAD(P)-dependent oxidoreductase [Patulibacter minatonensis]